MNNKTNDIEFLKDLQSQLYWEKKHAPDFVNGPQFWVIEDFEYVLANETYDRGEMIKQHDDKLFFSFTELKKHCEERFVEEIIDDERLSDLLYENNDIDKLWEYMLEHHNDGYFTEVFMKQVSYVVPGTLFITRAEAEAHLRRNVGSSYTNRALIQPMNISDSPQVERLLGLLLNFNFNAFNDN